MPYNTCVIKNLDASDQSVLGVVLAQNETYTIPDSKRIKAFNDSSILDRISSQVLQIGDGTNFYTTTADQLNYLRGDLSERDITGREVIRTAATVKGWHYQAHSVQFEVNKLNSIYNKDADGNDLGYCELKVYDDQGSECTTQASADTDGVKTIVTWKPDFDFEIISGNVRQASKETVDSYIHVRLQSPTGLAAPNDWFAVPFTQGGINLKYIGADEPLKTDGRASKLVTAGTNGDYFEIIANYDADVLTNNNRHEMSIIFEIYKDPTS